MNVQSMNLSELWKNAGRLGRSRNRKYLNFMETAKKEKCYVRTVEKTYGTLKTVDLATALIADRLLAKLPLDEH